eukprot:3311250-Prymnesium_polylepis.1
MSANKSVPVMPLPPAPPLSPIVLSAWLPKAAAASRAPRCESCACRSQCTCRTWACGATG